MNEIKEKQEELASVEKNKEQADEVLKEKKKEAGKRSRELAELEQKIRVVVSKASHAFHYHMICQCLRIFGFFFVWSFQIEIINQNPQIVQN